MASARRRNVRMVPLVAVLVMGRLLRDELVRNTVRAAVRRLRAGDPEPVLGLLAPDVRFRFPGRNSWATDVRGRDEVRLWLRRFVDAGLRLDVDDILVAGPPWATRVCVRFTDHCDDESGRLVYLNRGVILAEVSWGRAVRYDVVVDTEKVAELDAYLAGRA